MDAQSLYHFLKCQYQLYEVPIRVYESGKLAMRFDNYSIGEYEPNRDEAVLRTLQAEIRGPVYFNIQGSLMIEGAVFDQSSDRIIYAGLARTVRISEQVARRYLLGLGVTDLPEEVILRFHGYMNSLPILSPGLMAVILSGINAVVNGSVIEPRNIFESNVEAAGTDAGVGKSLLAQRELRYFGGMDNVNAHDIENRFLFCVKNGMVKELREMCRQEAGFNLYGDAANPDAWRITKDRCIVAVAVVSRAAIAAGLPAIEGAQLCDLYIQKAELCKTGRSLNQVRYDMLIDFTERVRELQLRTVENQIIRSVTDYILEHLEEKVTLTELAKRFNLNKNYLCGMFKEEMGIGITEYANYHKVNMAKQLLRFTDKPLSEISSYLSFCSQSYFQKVFKRVTGTTPTAYRNSGEA